MINIYLSALETAEEKAKFEDLYIKYKQRMYAIAYKATPHKSQFREK